VYRSVDPTAATWRFGRLHPQAQTTKPPRTGEQYAPQPVDTVAELCFCHQGPLPNDLILRSPDA